jgi:hypothetical protein
MGVKVSFKFSKANLHSNEFPAAVQHVLRAMLGCSPIFSTPEGFAFNKGTRRVGIVKEDLMERRAY